MDDPPIDEEMTTPQEMSEMVRAMTNTSHEFSAKYPGTCPVTGIPFYAGERVRRSEELGVFPTETMRRLKMRGLPEVHYAPFGEYDAEKALQALEACGEITLYTKAGKATIWRWQEGPLPAKPYAKAISPAQFKSRSRHAIFMVATGATRTVNVD